MITRNEMALQMLDNRLEEFELRMKDNWTPQDYDRHDELQAEYRRMAREFVELFGGKFEEYEQCEYIDDVYALREKMRG
jgi:hypothetical protein